MAALSQAEQVRQLTQQFYRDYWDIIDPVLPEEVYRTKLASLRVLHTDITESIAKLPEYEQRDFRLFLVQSEQQLAKLKARVHHVAHPVLSEAIVGQFCESPAFPVALGYLSEAPIGLEDIPQSSQRLEAQRVGDAVQEVRMLEQTICNHPAFKNLSEDVKEAIANDLNEVSAIVNRETIPNANGSAGSYDNYGYMQNRVRTLAFLPLHRIFAHFTTQESKDLAAILCPRLPLLRSTIELAIIKHSEEDVESLVDKWQLALAIKATPLPNQYTGEIEMSAQDILSLACINTLQIPDQERKEVGISSITEALIEHLNAQRDMEPSIRYFYTDLLVMMLGHLKNPNTLENFILQQPWWHNIMDDICPDILTLIRNMPNKGSRKLVVLNRLLGRHSRSFAQHLPAFFAALDTVSGNLDTVWGNDEVLYELIRHLTCFEINHHIEAILMQINKVALKGYVKSLREQLLNKLCLFKNRKQSLRVLLDMQSANAYTGISIGTILLMLFNNNRDEALEYIETHITDPEERQRLLALFC